MNWVVRMTVVVVLVGMATALPGVQAFAVAPNGHSDGCHSHTPVSPVKYQCCANGHNWAIAASPIIMLAPVALNSSVEFNLLSYASSQLAMSASVSSSPPGELPLRI